MVPVEVRTYSRTSLLRPPMGPVEVSLVESGLPNSDFESGHHIQLFIAGFPGTVF